MLQQERQLLEENLPISQAKFKGYGAVGKTRSRGSSITSALLGQPNEGACLLEPAPEWGAAVEAGVVRTTYIREAKVIATSALPLYVTFVLQYSLTICSIFSAGSLGKNELAGVSLGAMTATITGFAVHQGLATALDTLCSQAYGSGNKTLVGIHLQRMVAFLMVVTAPIILLWEFSLPILEAIVPEKELCAFASLYLRILACGAPGFALFESGKRFAQAQGIFSAGTYVLLLCAPLNAVFSYLLVWHPKIGMGFIGAPISVVITNWLLPLFLFLYIYCFGGSECWGGFSKKALTNWGPMIKLAIPGLIMVVAEWLAFEILTLMASYFSTAHVAAQSVLSTTCSLTFQLPFAVSVAISTRIANFVGATLGDAACTTAKLGFMISAAVGLFNLLLMMTIRHQVAKLFTDDQEVIDLYVKTLPVGAVLQFFDAVGSCTAGMLRGQGRQYLGSYINLVAYYAIAMPISVVTAFVLNWNLYGLWCGVAIALFCIAVIETVILYRTDWDQVVEEARNRINLSC